MAKDNETLRWEALDEGRSFEWGIRTVYEDDPEWVKENVQKKNLPDDIRRELHGDD